MAGRKRQQRARCKVRYISIGMWNVHSLPIAAGIKRPDMNASLVAIVATPYSPTT